MLFVGTVIVKIEYLGNQIILFLQYSSQHTTTLNFPNKIQNLSVGLVRVKCAFLQYL